MADDVSVDSVMQHLGQQISEYLNGSEEHEEPAAFDVRTGFILLVFPQEPGIEAAPEDCPIHWSSTTDIENSARILKRHLKNVEHGEFELGHAGKLH